MISINQVSIAVLKCLIEDKSARCHSISLLLDKIEFGEEGRYKGSKQYLEVERLLLQGELEALNKSLNAAIDEFIKQQDQIS